MSLTVGSTVLALALAGAQLVGQAPAQNEGLADLDRATEVKLSWKTLADLGEVIRLCESALKKGLDQDNAPFAKQLLASTRIQRGSMIADTILKSRPPDPMWPQFRRVAMEDLERGVELDPDQPEALLRIAQLNLLPGGDAKRASGALDEAIRLSNEDPAFRTKALTLRATLDEDPKKKIADLDEAIRTNPHDVDAVRLRGAVHADQEQYEKALADFDTALQMEPDDAATHLERGKVLVELKKYDEAVASLDKAGELAPQSAAPLIQKARIYGIQSKLDKALEALNLAHTLEPANPAVLLLRASVYQEKDDAEKALADVDQVLKAHPDLPIAMRFRASILAQSGKFDLAARQLEELQKSEPADLEVELQLGLFYSAEKQYKKAIEKFQAVLEKQPENAVALRGRGDVLLSLGRQAEAIADYEKAIKIDPDDTGVLNNLAWVLATSPDEKLRNGKRAIELATKACELTEYKKPHILSTLAAGYAETGDFNTALKWSQKAVDTGDEEQLEALKKELESYKAGKPVREILNEPEEPQAPASEKPEAKKPEAKKPETEKPETEKPQAEKSEAEHAEKPKPEEPAKGEPEPKQP
jgi:tetratricopeptide (TPR) repeat protein